VNIVGEQGAAHPRPHELGDSDPNHVGCFCAFSEYFQARVGVYNDTFCVQSKEGDMKMRTNLYDLCYPQEVAWSTKI
jgi:hypothetical protein